MKVVSLEVSFVRHTSKYIKVLCVVKEFVSKVLILNFVITQSIKVSIKIEFECCVVFRVHFKPHG